MKIEKRFKPTKRKGKTTSPKKKGLKRFVGSNPTPLLEFIILGSGKNIHQTVPYSENAKYVSEASASTEYKVNPDNLLVVKPFLKKKKLVAIFKANGTPIKIEGKKQEISAESLFLADQSRSLKHGLESVFAKHFDLKKILFFIIIGVIAVVVIMILTGGIRI